MSNLAEHEAEQAAITALCESGQCDHPECRQSWHKAATDVFDGAIQRDENDERAARVLLAIYPAYDDDNLETAIRDVLGDLRHLCDLMDWDFSEIDHDARETYLRELGIRPHGAANNPALKAAIERDLQ